VAVDRTKVLAAAQKHLSKGNYDKAINEYKKLVDADPRDVRTWLKIGDLYTRKGAHREATQTYHRVAEHYANQGFFLKAVAVYKQILKLQPGRLDISMRLAEMYENLQLISDALSTYEQAAQAYGREGNVDKMLETLGKMAELDPENIPVRIKYAEALSKAGKTGEAADEFEAGAELLKEQGRMDDYVKVAERLLYHRAEDTDLARTLAELYLQRNDAKRALSKLQTCFKVDPKDVRTLELLARAFHVLGQTPKTISVYREIAKIHQEKGDAEQRAHALKKILELDPNDAEARQALAGYAPSTAQQRPRKSAPVPVAAPDEMPGAVVATEAPPPIDDEPEMFVDDEPEMFVDDEPEMFVDEPEMIVDEPEMIVDEPELLIEDSDSDIMIVEEELDDLADVEIIDPALEDDDPVLMVDEDIVDPMASEPPPAEPARPSIPPDVAREAQIARLMTECDVFSRYGLKDKVIAQLEQVLTIAPEHVEARERLKDALLDAGRTQEAAAQLIALADLISATASPKAGALYLRQALELDPDNVEAQQKLAAADAMPSLVPGAHPVPTPAEVPPAPEVPEFDDESEADILFVDDDEAAEGPADTAASVEAPPPQRKMREDEPPSAVMAEMPPPPAEGLRTAESLIPDAMELPEPVALDEEEPEEAEPATSLDVPSPLLDELDEPAPRVPPAVTPAALTPPTKGLTPPEVRAERTVVATPEMLQDPAPLEPADAPIEPLPEELEYLDQQTEASTTDPAEELAEEALEPVSVAEFEAAPLDPNEGHVQAAKQRLSIPPGEIEETLDEADFFLAQGLFDAAQATVEDALESHPGHVVLQDKLQEILDARAGSQLPPPPPADDEDDAFALAEKLAEELDDEESVGPASEGSDVIDVDNVFEQFKKGVSEQIGADDSDTHFDLGIAYKEMGLLDDAITEFQMAMTNPARECICQTMMGICRVEQGKYTDGIHHFKKGLYADQKSEREELGLYFELGNAYELLEDPKEALYYYQKVTKRDPEFRGVQERIARLTSPEPEPEANVDPLMLDDVDQAFDDLLSDE